MVVNVVGGEYGFEVANVVVGVWVVVVVVVRCDVDSEELARSTGSKHKQAQRAIRLTIKTTSRHKERGERVSRTNLKEEPRGPFFVRHATLGVSVRAAAVAVVVRQRPRGARDLLAGAAAAVVVGDARAVRRV
jgi:hypothetical protein